jgi:protein-disulfide isomerase
MASRKEQKDQLRAERLARESEEQAAARRKRLVQYGALAGLLAVVVVAALIIASQNNSSDSSGAGAGGDVADVHKVDNQLKGLPQNGLVLGDPKAKVNVIEFGDLQCPVCKEFSFQVAPDIISQIVRKGQATYEFRPWDIIGPQSPIASRAAYAAGEQGVGWNFIELFYRNQGEENSGYVTDSFLTSIAQGAEVKDIDKWNTDRKSSKWDSPLGTGVPPSTGGKTDAEAKSLGFTGTPSILVEGPGGKKPFTTIPTVSQIEAAVKSVQ